MSAPEMTMEGLLFEINNTLHCMLQLMMLQAGLQTKEQLIENLEERNKGLEEIINECTNGSPD